MGTAEQQAAAAVDRLLAGIDGAAVFDLRGRVDETEAAGWPSQLTGGPYAAVVLGDLLEQLDPHQVFSPLADRSVLADDGSAILTIRDASHPEVVAALGQGRTGSGGVLDRVQRSWFTPDSARLLLEEHGFVVDRAIGVDPSAPDARPRAFVVRACRSGSAGELAAVRDRLTALERDRDRLEAEVSRARALLVEERALFDAQVDQGMLDIAGLRRRNESLRRQLEKARSRRDELRVRRDQLQGQRDELKEQRDRAQAEAERLRADLATYAGSRWVRANRRLVNRIRRLRGGGR